MRNTQITIDAITPTNTTLFCHLMRMDWATLSDAQSTIMQCTELNRCRVCRRWKDLLWSTTVPNLNFLSSPV